MPKKLALVLDAGTTEIKSVVFDNEGKIVSRSSRAINKNVSEDSVRVEQDPREILDLARVVLKEAVSTSGATAENCKGLGITNQRETVVVWDKTTGEPIYPAIVWQDSRTKERCEEVAKEYSEKIRDLTGLTPDTYFSASKLEWILKNTKAETENILAGTIDSWLMWNLLDGNPHLTDFTNASRTLLFNIKEKKWDDELLSIWPIPKQILPEAKHSLSHFGELSKEILNFSLPLLAVSGDQQASMYAAKRRGFNAKVTYGTGTFLMQELGDEFKLEKDFFTTLTPSVDGPVYALEAKIGSYGNQIAKLLEKHETLAPVVDEILQKTALYITRLSYKPEKILLDGGITQAPDFLKKQSNLCPDIHFELQTPFDGTALGIALMILDSTEK